MRNIIFVITTIVIFGTLNILIYKKEMTIQHGKTVFLDLAPLDPRSLIQGDYMILRYRLSQQITRELKPEKSGYIVLAEKDEELDTNNIAPRQGSGAYLQLTNGKVKELLPIRFYNESRQLAPGEHLLKYHYRNGNAQISAGKTDAYFFQEGHAKYYDQARYGSIKLAESGEAVLHNLYNQKFKLIESNKKPQEK